MDNSGVLPSLEEQARTVFTDTRAARPKGQPGGGDGRGFPSRAEAETKGDPPHLVWRVLTYADLSAIESAWWKTTKARMRDEWGCALSFRAKRHALAQATVPSAISLRGEEVAAAFDVFLDLLFEEQGDFMSMEDLVAFPMPSIFAAGQTERNDWGFTCTCITGHVNNIKYKYYNEPSDVTVRELRQQHFAHAPAPGTLAPIRLRSRPREARLRSRAPSVRLRGRKRRRSTDRRHQQHLLPWLLRRMLLPLQLLMLLLLLAPLILLLLQLLLLLLLLLLVLLLVVAVVMLPLLRLLLQLPVWWWWRWWCDCCCYCCCCRSRDCGGC